MAKLCDVYVNDAFGTAHRAEATTHGIAKHAPIACAGPLLAAELDALGRALAAPERPLVAIVAGSKVSTKLTILRALAAKVDALIVGGGIANTFILAAGGDIGKLARRARARRRGEGDPRRVSGQGADPGRRGRRQGIQGERGADAEGDRERRARRPDPRPRADVGGGAENDHRARRDHRLERAGRRVRVRRVRRRHQGDRRSDRRTAMRSRSRAAATRSPRSRSSALRTGSATSRPAAAPSSNSSKARRCRRWRCWSRGRRIERRTEDRHQARFRHSRRGFRIEMNSRNMRSSSYML